jgi:hypothetical protein
MSAPENEITVNLNGWDLYKQQCSKLGRQKDMVGN